MSGEELINEVLKLRTKVEKGKQYKDKFKKSMKQIERSKL